MEEEKWGNILFYITKVIKVKWRMTLIDNNCLSAKVSRTQNVIFPLHRSSLVLCCLLLWKWKIWKIFHILRFIHRYSSFLKRKKISWKANYIVTEMMRSDQSLLYALSGTYRIYTLKNALIRLVETTLSFFNSHC